MRWWSSRTAAPVRPTPARSSPTATMIRPARSCAGSIPTWLAVPGRRRAARSCSIRPSSFRAQWAGAWRARASPMFRPTVRRGRAAGCTSSSMAACRAGPPMASATCSSNAPDISGTPTPTASCCSSRRPTPTRRRTPAGTGGATRRPTTLAKGTAAGGGAGNARPSGRATCGRHRAIAPRQGMTALSQWRRSVPKLVG